MKHDLTSATDRYSRLILEASHPPTRDEAESLKIEVLRSAMSLLVEEMLSQIADDKKRINQRERTIGRIKAAMMMTAPMHDRAD